MSLHAACLISVIIRKKAFSVVSFDLQLEFHPSSLAVTYILYYIVFCKPMQHANWSGIIQILFRAASVHIYNHNILLTKRLEFHHYHPLRELILNEVLKICKIWKLIGIQLSHIAIYIYIYVYIYIYI